MPVSHLRVYVGAYVRTCKISSALCRRTGVLVSLLILLLCAWTACPRCLVSPQTMAGEIATEAATGTNGTTPTRGILVTMAALRETTATRGETIATRGETIAIRGETTVINVNMIAITDLLTTARIGTLLIGMTGRIALSMVEVETTEGIVRMVLQPARTPSWDHHLPFLLHQDTPLRLIDSCS